MSLRSFRMLLQFALVVVLFGVSLMLPAILFRQMSTASRGVLLPAGHVVKTGKQLALASLLGPLFFNYAGLANPLLLLGCVLVLRRNTRAGVTCLVLAVLFALQTFQLMVSPYHEDEGGVLVSFMVRPLVGWYCWLGAILLAFLLALEQLWFYRHTLTPHEGDRS